MVKQCLDARKKVAEDERGQSGDGHETAVGGWLLLQAHYLLHTLGLLADLAAEVVDLEEEPLQLCGCQFRAHAQNGEAECDEEDNVDDHKQISYHWNLAHRKVRYQIEADEE